MLITFKTRASYPDITMFGDAALKLLKLMGRTGTVPSAMYPEDIPSALQRLRDALAAMDAQDPERVPPGAEDDDEPPVGLHERAVPLIELFEAASAEAVPVMWEQGGRSY